MSRISLYLDRLSLDDLMFLEEELQRRKEKFRNDYAVMAIQTEQRTLTSLRRELLVHLVSDLKRYYNENAASGSGVMLAFSPEASLLLFKDVQSAGKTATQLITGLAELNGRLGLVENRLTLKLGLAFGSEVLSVGSKRSIRHSALVRRAGQCAWKAAASTMLIDEFAMQRWVLRKDAIRMPIDIDGVSVYRVSLYASEAIQRGSDEEQLMLFLKGIVDRGIRTLKYSLLREDADSLTTSAWAKPVARAVITLEAFDPLSMRNLTFSVRCALSDYAEKVERVRGMVSEVGLGLVKHEDASHITAS